MLRSSWSVLITKIISSIEEFDYLIWYLRLESVDNTMSNEGIALKPEMIIRRGENAGTRKLDKQKIGQTKIKQTKIGQTKIGQFFGFIAIQNLCKWEFFDTNFWNDQNISFLT